MKKGLALLFSGMGAMGLGWLLVGWVQAFAPYAQAPLTSTTSAQNMVEVGHSGGLADAVFISGTLAYVGLGAELAVMDVTNPFAPERLSYISFPALVTDIDVANNVAYVAAARSCP